MLPICVIRLFKGFLHRSETTRNLTFFTRRGSLVQIQHRPLRKTAYLSEKLGSWESLGATVEAL